MSSFEMGDFDIHKAREAGNPLLSFEEK